MHVIGTAGHVDHGKSTLVTALTGINPDRLKEEREREMTIDLGFAWLGLPNGEEAGIVDVPGHRDFIENMLAGMGGIDLVLLVIAADEGIMPQTREHLAIIDLLGIKNGIIVLTKTDLISDEGWFSLVEGDIRRAVAGTTLQDASILRVSARQRTGLEELIQKIQETLQTIPARQDGARPRLPIDRVFSLTGFGTVVTGTLLDGKLQVGDEIEILPAGIRGRIRGLQTHKKKEEQALPGNRTAINISGVDVQQISRGQVLTRIGTHTATQRMDVNFRLLADESSSLKHHSEVKLFLGAAEVNAKVRVLGREEIHAGEIGYLQLELETPIVAVKGDHFILRRPSPPATLGGGVVLDPFPARRHRRFVQDVLTILQQLEHGSAEDGLLQISQKVGIVPLKELREKSHLPQEDFDRLLKQLLTDKKAILLEAGDAHQDANQLVASEATIADLRGKVVKTLTNFYSANPMRMGLKKEEVRAKIGLPLKAADALINHLVTLGTLQEEKNLLRLSGREIRFSAEQQRAVDRLLKEFNQRPYTPPLVEECTAMVGKEVFQALVERGDLAQVSAEVVFDQADLQTMMAEIEAVIKKSGSITLAQVRDQFQTSRRYALAVLEAMDRQGITSREGDLRKLRNK